MSSSRIIMSVMLVALSLGGCSKLERSAGEAASDQGPGTKQTADLSQQDSQSKEHAHESDSARVSEEEKQRRASTEKIDLVSNLSLEISRSSDKPHLSFFEGYKAVLTEPLPDGDDVSVFYPRTSRFLLQPERNPDHPKNLVPTVGVGLELDKIPTVRTALVRLTQSVLPNIIIRHESQGKLSFSVYEVSKNFRHIGTVYPGSEIKLVSCKNDPVMRIAFSDYLPDFGIQAVSTEIIYRYENGKFVFDRKMMAENAPLKSDRNYWKQRIRKGFQITHDVPLELTDVVCEYVYCGKAKEARAFVDRCWPSKRRGKEAYWRFITNEVKKSPYYSAIKLANQLESSG